jgi:hypothetical protein
MKDAARAATRTLVGREYGQSANNETLTFWENIYKCFCTTQTEKGTLEAAVIYHNKCNKFS